MWCGARMAAHHRIFAGVANKACFRSVMGAAMHMIFNAWRKRKTCAQCRKIKPAREIDPLAAILAPSLAAECDFDVVREQISLKRAQMFANH